MFVCHQTYQKRVYWNNKWSKNDQFWLVYREWEHRYCSHQITFLINSFFRKILHGHSSLFPTICASCKRCLCFASHFRASSLLSENSMNAYPKHRSVPCVKRHPFPLFLFMLMDSDVSQVASLGEMSYLP